jgi:hypothetical protein
MIKCGIKVKLKTFELEHCPCHHSLINLIKYFMCCVLLSLDSHVVRVSVRILIK